MQEASTRREPFDAIVIGAGICGIIFLKYARDAGLRCMAIEKQDEVGGLWNWLPAWQDIQNRTQDFAINDVPLEGAEQPDVQRHARAWVERYDLAPFIELQCEATSVSRRGDQWQVRTNRGVFLADYLIAATGVQNRPEIPEVDRSESDVIELHSSGLRHPEDLREQRVAVVGGGASSWDLLDLAIENGAREVHWVYRSTRWFLPTTKSKQDAFPNLRELAEVQTTKRSTKSVSEFLRKLLKRKYAYFHLTDIEPQEPFDITRHQLIPGRSSMIGNFDQITRHRSEVRSIRKREITLESGERFETDVLLWATGYRMNLGYFDLPELRDIHTLEQLKPRLGSLVRSLDAPNLFFVGMTLTESTSATPFFAAIEAKSIVSHIQGRCEIPQETTPHLVAYWDLFKHFASFDRHNYPRLWWRLKYFVLVWWYGVFRNKTVRV